MSVREREREREWERERDGGSVGVKEIKKREEGEGEIERCRSRDKNKNIGKSWEMDGLMDIGWVLWHINQIHFYVNNQFYFKQFSLG